MPSHTRLMAICVGLAASFSCTAGAFAQAQPAPQPDPADRTTLGAAPSLPHFDWIEPRYKIEAVRFKCRDETGFDWAGSDTVMVGTFDAKGWTVSNEFEDVDTGETRNFDPAKSCIVPVRPGTVVLGQTSVCDDGGEPAPLGFEVEFWEKDDFGTPPFSFCVATQPAPGYHGGPHCVDDRVGDDFIGHARIDFSMQELEARLPNVGAETYRAVRLSGCPGGQVCGATDFPDYIFTYRVTRLPDVNVSLISVLHDAMPKIGARSELEAIVAGLRSLRALSQRKDETETSNGH